MIQSGGPILGFKTRLFLFLADKPPSSSTEVRANTTSSSSSPSPSPPTTLTTFLLLLQTPKPHNTISSHHQSKLQGSFLVCGMAVEERVGEDLMSESSAHQTSDITLHAFSDMSRVSPILFIYLLKEAYTRGTGSASPKFHFLQLLVRQLLHNSPQPGPATFVMQCLFALPVFGPNLIDGFSHLVISSFRHVQTVPADLSKAQILAAQLAIRMIDGEVFYGDNILIKLLEAFDVRRIHIQQATCRFEEGDDTLYTKKASMESFISRLIQLRLYKLAVALLERFAIRHTDQSILLKMMQENEFAAAEKWATFMGKPMICTMVQKYIDMKMLKKAYKFIKENDLQNDFSDAYRMCKESSLKKLAEKGCWDVAEAKTHGDKQLLEYLVYLAMEAGYCEKVDEICERHSLKGFSSIKETATKISRTNYLNFDELTTEEIIWVDDVEGLLSATSHIEGCKVVGVDCEWKPNYEKGSKPNKVSIMQIASEKTAFIIDLLKLSVSEPDALNSCLGRILHSPSILKLGYNLQCDLKQLSHSYNHMECFRHYEMLLDIQNVFKERSGGLSGLAEKILGAGLNKTRRNSDWEQRPLSEKQMEYAALDAVVLVHIFAKIDIQRRSCCVNEGETQLGWKSNIISRMDDLKKPKTKKKYKKKKNGRGGSVAQAVSSL